MDCIFLPLDKKWGIKTYDYKVDRDYSFFLQRRCAKLNLGPDVGNRFTFQIIEGKRKHRKYCYSTEIVKTFTDDESDIFDKKYEREASKVKDILLKKLKWNFLDDHMFNWGIKNNKLIPIDFGWSSLY